MYNVHVQYYKNYKTSETITQQGGQVFETVHFWN